MKLSTVLAISGVLAVGAVAQEPTQAPATQTPAAPTPATQAPAKKQTPATKRVYVVDEKDVYKATVTMEGGFAATMTGTLTEKVKKVYPNGDADLEETVSDIQTSGEVPPDTSTEPHIIKVNAYGVAQGDGGQTPLTYAVMGKMLPEVNDLLDLEQAWPFERAIMSGVSLNANAKVTNQEWPDNEIGLQGNFSQGEMKGGLTGDLIWNAKDVRYNKATFVMKMAGPNGQGDVKLTLSFERVIPAPVKKG